MTADYQDVILDNLTLASNLTLTFDLPKTSMADHNEAQPKLKPKLGSTCTADQQEDHM